MTPHNLPTRLIGLAVIGLVALGLIAGHNVGWW